jgi:exopolysaccharide production protein ExoY
VRHPAPDGGRTRRSGRWHTAPLKRGLDVAIALPGLLLAMPVMALIALAIRLDSPGPILYHQPRVGRQGRHFSMVKFRTMQRESDELLHRTLMGDPAALTVWRVRQKLKADPRITRVGRVLRQWSLDELPQFWNVLRGDMTLVGPRPIIPDQRAEYGPALARYYDMRPGMTGVWQVSGRNRLSFMERVACDEHYYASCSPTVDLRILARTVVAVATREGAW